MFYDHDHDHYSLHISMTLIQLHTREKIFLYVDNSKLFFIKYFYKIFFYFIFSFIYAYAKQLHIKDRFHDFKIPLITNNKAALCAALLFVITYLFFEACTSSALFKP